jgi:hypothetical protein
VTLRLVDAAGVPFDPAALLRTLVDHDVDVVITGGIAALAHGDDRATGHADVVDVPLGGAAAHAGAAAAHRRRATVGCA